MAKTQIMVVEDESIVAEDIKSNLQSMGYEVSSIISSGKEAIKKAKELRPDLVLMDIMLKGKMDGIDAASHIWFNLDIPVIYIMSYSDDETLKRAKITEPFGYIIKPFDDRELHIVIETALYKHKLEKELKKNQDLILQAKKEWEETFNIIDEAITIHDKDFNIIRANKAAEKLLGLQFKNILSHKCYESYHGTECPPEKCPSCKTLKTGMPSTTEFFEPNLNKYIEIKALPRLDKNGNLIGLVHVVTDITHKKKLENDLREISITDELTGIYNRRGFLALTEQQLKIANRENKSFIILYADLDGFKEINDKYGHKEGDNVLIEAANILKKSFRDSDIIARIGGDEFVVLAMETPEISIDMLTNRLKINLDVYNAKSGKPYMLSFSEGFVRYNPKQPSSIEALLSKADKLMYEHKNVKNRKS
jgi:diguanylate cyclase (GGDEF)-like protein/PAS domain S-box-containing protein